MTTLEMLQIIPNILAGAVLIVGVTFAGVYARYADWRLTAPGRALMHLIICFDALILMNTIHLATGEYAAQWLVRSVVFSALLWSMTLLLLTLINILRDGKPITLWAFVVPSQKTPNPKKADAK